MGKIALKYSAVLIGAYLLVGYQTNWGTFISDSAGGAATVITAFQGRSVAK